MSFDSNPSRQIYDQFINEIEKSSPSIYYDEDDLIDIFDTASDLCDTTTQLEVLLLGYKLFPESEDLLKRRAAFILDTNENSLENFMRLHSSKIKNDFLWELFRIRANNNSTNTIEEQILELLDRFKLVDDEEIIQFIGVIHHFKLDQWLFENLDRVKPRVEYPQTLLYELARVSETSSQLTNGASLMEELTDIDPLNFDYWCVMADIQSSRGKYADALNALEFAKAINANDSNIAALEGYLLMELHEPAKAVKCLEKAIETSDKTLAEPAFQNLTEAYKQLNREADLRPLVKKLFERNAADANRLIDMLCYFPEESLTSLRKFHEASLDTNETSTLQRVTQMVGIGRINEAITYLNWYIENFSDSQTLKFSYIELLYNAQRYNECFKYIDKNFSGLVLEPNELPVVILIASTLLRVGQFENALIFCNHWINQIDKCTFDNSAIKLISRGLKSQLNDIIEAIRRNRNLSADDIQHLAL